MMTLIKQTLSVTGAAVCCAVMLSVGTTAAKAAPLPPKMVLPDELPIPRDLEGIEDMTVIIVDDYVCVTDKDGSVLYNTNVPADSLTKGARKMLEEGIPVTNYFRLLQLIENYTS